MKRQAFEAILEALAAEPDPPTTVADPWRDHVEDSLVALPYVGSPASIADMGSGVGFPGLAMAVALPDSRVTLIESVRRHADVAARLAAAGGLDNVSVVASRVEELGRPESFDVVTARALAPLAVLVEWAAPLLGSGGRGVFWKGSVDSAERLGGEAAAAAVGLSLEHEVQVEPFPGAHSRFLWIYAKTGETPERFPRRSGIARKRPLGA